MIQKSSDKQNRWLHEWKETSRSCAKINARLSEQQINAGQTCNVVTFFTSKKKKNKKRARNQTNPDKEGEGQTKGRQMHWWIYEQVQKTLMDVKKTTKLTTHKWRRNKKRMRIRWRWSSMPSVERCKDRKEENVFQLKKSFCKKSETIGCKWSKLETVVFNGTQVERTDKSGSSYLLVLSQLARPEVIGKQCSWFSGGEFLTLG